MVMESFSPTKSAKRKVCLYDDESRYLEFNPNDLFFQKRLKDFYVKLTEKSKSLNTEQKRIEALGEENDEYGVSKAGLELMEIQTGIANFVVSGWDDLFGKGCYERLFGNEFDPEVIGEVIGYVAGEINKAKSKTIDEKLAKRRTTKKVMK